MSTVLALALLLSTLGSSRRPCNNPEVFGPQPGCGQGFGVFNKASKPKLHTQNKATSYHFGPATINQGSYQGPPTTQPAYTSPPKTYHFGPSNINQNRAAKPKLSAMADYNDKGEQGG